MGTTAQVFLFWGMYFAITWAVAALHDAWTPEPWSYFDKYPWKCAKCLTTWTLAASYISVACMLSSPLFGVFGTLLAAGEGMAQQYTEKERLQ